MQHVPTLRELQNLFFRAITALPGDLAAAPRFLATVERSATLNACERLQVYGDAYVWRLTAVLREDFPRVAALLGDERFADVVRRFLRCHPSTHPSVTELGRRFAPFLRRCDELPGWIADLARLERARLDVFNAASADSLTMDVLRALLADAWPSLRVAAIPALRVLRMRWPVQRVWDPANDATPDTLAPQPTTLRIWRAADHRVFHATVDRREARALTRLRAGQTFGEICSVFADLAPDEAAASATALLARWVEDGVVAAPASMSRGAALAVQRRTTASSGTR